MSYKCSSDMPVPLLSKIIRVKLEREHGDFIEESN